MKESLEVEQEKGRAIIQKEGTMFSIFQRKVSRLLVGSENIDEDRWVFLYNAYAHYRYNFKNKESVSEWATDMFCEYDPNKHDIYLKNEKKRIKSDEI